MRKVMLAACAAELWLLPLVFATGGCSVEKPPPQFDSMSEQDVTRIVEDAIVNTMGDPGQTTQQRRIALEQARYNRAYGQIATMHFAFKQWIDFEKEHPRHWYSRLGVDAGSSDRVTRNLNVLYLRMSAIGAIGLSCPVSSAEAHRQGEFLGENLSVEETKDAYAFIDRDVVYCLEVRRKSIKELMS